MNTGIDWSTEELEALQTTRLFQIKGTIIKKVWSHFESLRDALREEVGSEPLLAPSEIDLHKGQVAKGENHLLLPFVYLDFPKYFSHDEKCTYRTFFWGGNYVVYALILEGSYLADYKIRIKRHYDRLAQGSIHLAITPDPWEWRRGTPYTLPLTPENQKIVEAVLEERSSLKLERFLDLNAPSFREGNLLMEGVHTFRLLKPILLP